MIRAAVIALAIVAAPSPALAQESSPTGWIRNLLRDAAAAPGVCGQHDAAARGTLARLQGLELPEKGKLIVVNIPSGVVTAYEDGHPVIESRAVVGKEDTPTPEMDTRVTYVRANPTWTVPESILKSKGWREKLADDPGYFEENGFDVIVGGQALSPWEAADDPWSVTAFVQRPSPTNALGMLKIGLDNADGIYIHDTNDPGRFESEVRAASAGCVRVERVRELGAWILGLSDHEMDGLVDGGDVENRTPPEPVRVILGYWTAWPDASESLRFYPDIYGLDGSGPECGDEGYGGGHGNLSPQWTEYQTR